ncbi:MAG: hypothetical protein J0H92_11750 [Sphingobacteriales bacterium]|nr:hypothetical protein [Sphingobacteriales bacterium]OJW35058.1 MAG: hypothetical protein BGO54_02590 [Sphingobacteriales bacterium 46-32]
MKKIYLFIAIVTYCFSCSNNEPDSASPNTPHADSANSPVPDNNSSKDTASYERMPAFRFDSAGRNQ